jgi:hypothetical protein
MESGTCRTSNPSRVSSPSGTQQAFSHKARRNQAYTVPSPAFAMSSYVRILRRGLWRDSAHGGAAMVALVDAQIEFEEELDQDQGHSLRANTQSYSQILTTPATLSPRLCSEVR